MPIQFQLTERLAGFCLETAGPGEQVLVQTAGVALASDPVQVQHVLDGLQSALFSHIPNLPDPSRISGLLVLVRPDLSATAYVNELQALAKTKLNRSVQKGDPMYLEDLRGLASVSLGVDVPSECAVVLVASLLWKRSVYFDFGPIGLPARERLQPMSEALLQQYRSLVGLPVSLPWGSPEGQTAESALETPSELSDKPPQVRDPLVFMSDAIQRLGVLVASDETKESELQQLLHEHPWMLGNQYSKMQRHGALDDRNIPDFTATRTADQCLDIVELKLPRMKVFKADGFSAEFQDAWSQVERYLGYAYRQAGTLLMEKNLRFENPKAILIAGRTVDDEGRKRIREKEFFSSRVTMLTYEQLLAQATGVLQFTREAIKALNSGA